MPNEIDTTNKFLVGANGDGILVMGLRTLVRPIPKPDALLLAAYLVVLAEAEDGQFQAVLDAVKGC